MRGIMVAAALVAVLFAGCSGGAGTESQEPAAEPEAFEDLTVSDSKGLIRGIVLSETITPLEGATVNLRLGSEPMTTLSDAQGAFVFTDLDAGDYFLTVSKPGYFDVQASATVVAGVAEPPIVKVQLVFDVVNQPYTELLQWSGFLQCGAAIPMVGSLNPCALTGSDNVHEFPFGTNRTPDFAQAEAFWSGTQPLGNYLSFGFYDPDSLASNWKSVNTGSPAVVNATQDEITEAVGDAGKLIVRLFPGTGPDGTNPTVVVEQRYDVYVSYFYGFRPPAGWIFVIDGSCSGPDECGA
ncbi:MAG: carboxypeptidase-like regulatory domain-containing protein [Thermoplasmatota archaeon]